MRLMTVERRFRSLQHTHMPMTLACVLLSGTLNAAAALPLDMNLQNGTAPQNATNGSGENTHPKKEKEKIYPIGGDVTPPKPLSTPTVDSGSYHGKVKRQGFVALRMVVNTDGVPEDIHVVRSGGKDLDAKAIDAMQQYRFSPAMRKGKPVAVQITIESQFSIYK
jgi:protein TonB